MPDQSLFQVVHPPGGARASFVEPPFPEAAFRAAGISGQFEVYYQPVFRLKDRSVAHYEALVRMRGKAGRLIPPGEFIPVAEKRGLISALDRLVADIVLRDLRAHPEVSVYINLSGVSLGDDALRKHLMLATEDPDIASRLGIELTETTVVKDTYQANAWITVLRAQGCRFALDDFGIGFNSLAYLRNLQFDQLKIDGSYVRAIVEDGKTRALIAAIQALAGSLGLETVAEWVETVPIMEAVTELGLTYGQGFLLGVPLPKFLGRNEKVIAA